MEGCELEFGKKGAKAVAAGDRRFRSSGNRFVDYKSGPRGLLAGNLPSHRAWTRAFAKLARLRVNATKNIQIEILRPEDRALTFGCITITARRFVYNVGIGR